MSSAAAAKQNENYANGSLKSCFFISPNDEPFVLPVDSTREMYPMLKKNFPRGFETYQIFIDDSQLEYISIFFDADNKGKPSCSWEAKLIAAAIGISPTGNMLIVRKKWINKEECLVNMDMKFGEFLWRGFTGRMGRNSAYLLPLCCWDNNVNLKLTNGETAKALLSLGNTREELKAKNDKKRKAKKAKKNAERKTRICSICATPTRNICNGCRLIYYCSTECQSSDWKKHKKICPCNC